MEIDDNANGDEDGDALDVNEMRDTDEFSNAMDYRRRKTAKWDTLEEREQEKLDEETRKIVEKYQKSDFAKMVAIGLRKQRAIVEAQDKESNESLPDSAGDSQLAEDGTSTGAQGGDDDSEDFVGNLSQRGRRGRRRGRKPNAESVTSSVTSPSNVGERGRRGTRGRPRGSKNRNVVLSESATSSNESTVTSSMTSSSTTSSSSSSGAAAAATASTSSSTASTSATASSSSSSSSSSASNYQRSPFRNLSPGINVVLEPFVVNPLRDPYLNQMYPLDRKYFMIPGEATVGVVSKYLAGRFGVSDRQVGLAIESSVDVPLNEDVPKIVSIPGYKSVSPRVSLLELNILRKKRNLMASSTLFFKYFYYYLPKQ